MFLIHAETAGLMLGFPDHPTRQCSRRAVFVGIVLCVILAGGCPSGDVPNASRDPAAKRLDGIRLKLLVVADSQLAQAIQQRSGDWQARTGSTVDVREINEAELESSGSLDADAVIYPAYWLGPLAERKWIRPLSPSLLADEELAWSGVFGAIRLREVIWSQQVYAIPFGSPVMLCYCRADLLSQLDRRPPTTWQEYLVLAQLLADRRNLGQSAPPPEQTWFGTVEPLGLGWAGITLLARAAASAKHPDHYSTLFSIDTMEPRITAPPLVRALGELVAAAKSGPAEARNFTPDDARKLFRSGQCGMALSWPSAAGVAANEAAEVDPPPVELVELPGSPDVFDPKRGKWVPRDGSVGGRVTLLGAAGRLGSVSQQSDNSDTAEQLLVWLVGPQWGWAAEIAATSPATTIFRDIHVAASEPWIEPLYGNGSPDELANVIQQSLKRRESLFALRIPGRARYLNALDAAVHQALDGVATPREALEAAADRWRAITGELGLESQRRAYRRSQGLR